MTVQTAPQLAQEQLVETSAKTTCALCEEACPTNASYTALGHWSRVERAPDGTLLQKRERPQLVGGLRACGNKCYQALLRSSWADTRRDEIARLDEEEAEFLAAHRKKTA